VLARDCGREERTNRPPGLLVELLELRDRDALRVLQLDLLFRQCWPEARVGVAAGLVAAACELTHDEEDTCGQHEC
jgi:hypothetical protein